MQKALDHYHFQCSPNPEKGSLLSIKRKQVSSHKPDSEMMEKSEIAFFAGIDELESRKVSTDNFEIQPHKSREGGSERTKSP
jgi:hypothetical protein